MQKTPKPRPVSALEEHLGFWLRFLSNAVSARFRGELEARGVSLSEWVALRRLYGAQAVPAAELIASLGMTKGAVSKVVDRLEAKGLVRRGAHAEDGRALTLKLTRAGKALVPRLATLADENDAHFFGPLSPDARRTLEATLRELVHRHGLETFPTE